MADNDSLSGCRCDTRQIDDVRLVEGDHEDPVTLGVPTKEPLRCPLSLGGCRGRCLEHRSQAREFVDITNSHKFAGFAGPAPRTRDDSGYRDIAFAQLLTHAHRLPTSVRREIALGGAVIDIEIGRVTTSGRERVPVEHGDAVLVLQGLPHVVCANRSSNRHEDEGNNHYPHSPHDLLLPLRSGCRNSCGDSDRCVSYCARVLTRFAPTPSGFLHIGNLVNFALIGRLASSHDARIALRVDDADAIRTRPEYVADIFDALRWLDLSWDLGPVSPDEMSTWSQGTRLGEYRRARDVVLQSGRAYACECTRRDWIGFQGERCPRSCVDRRLDFEPGVSTLRFTATNEPDPIIWRREDIPAYHLASVVDDDLLGVDLVVRGEDLREATQIQRQISSALPGSRFHDALVVHHPLVHAGDGSKLSKSAGARSAPLPRTPENRSAIDRRAAQMLSWIDDRLRSRGS